MSAPSQTPAEAQTGQPSPGNSPLGEPAREGYARAVLSIPTPVSVTLARKKCSLSRVISLVPGAILTFDAHCDEPLTLEAGGQAIATGEAVKIGDKFGLRIREILLVSGASQESSVSQF